MSSVVKIQPEKLFCIETNNEFTWHNIEITPAIEEVACAFRLSPIYELAVINKRNPNSSLYQVKSERGDFILRSVASVQRATTERQCHLANAVPYQNIVKPLRASPGSYTLTTEDKTWMVYAEKKGGIFSGTDCPVIEVIEQAIKLEQAFSILESSLLNLEKEHLPTVQHHPEQWLDFFRRLTRPEKLREMPFVHLSPTTEQLLSENKDAVMKWVESSADLPLGENIGLTHNDLQHANVLIDSGQPFFLDLEDVCLENREIAISHAVFKLLRHTVYTKAESAMHLRAAVVSSVINALALNGFRICDRRDLFLYGAYRIVSDIWEIVDYTHQYQDESQLYDLEKRIHNLFELFYLLYNKPVA